MTFLLRHLELHLTAVGLLVILSAGFLFQEQALGPWRITALVAIAVGAIHGCLFWCVRHRQRQVREQTIESAKDMLRDVVNNQLLIIQMADEMNRRRPGSVAPRTVDHSVAAISDALESLSRESLRVWSSKYEPESNREPDSSLVFQNEPTDEPASETGSHPIPSSGIVSGRGRRSQAPEETQQSNPRIRVSGRS